MPPAPAPIALWRVATFVLAVPALSATPILRQQGFLIFNHRPAGVGVGGGTSPWVMRRPGHYSEPSMERLAREKGQEVNDNPEPAKKPNHASIKSLWARYQDALEREPLPTKMITSSILSGFSDWLAQYFAYSGDHAYFTPDTTRMAIMMTLGFLYGPPIGHYWFQFLDRISHHPDVIKCLPGGRFGPVALQLVLDQTVAAALVNSGFLLLYWMAQAATQGRLMPLSTTLPVLFERLRQQFWPMMMANYRLWPLANLINFSIVPVNLRVLFSNVVAVAWSVFMSSTANHPKPA